MAKLAAAAALLCNHTILLLVATHTQLCEPPVHVLRMPCKRSPAPSAFAPGRSGTKSRGMPPRSHPARCRLFPLVFLTLPSPLPSHLHIPCQVCSHERAEELQLQYSIPQSHHRWCTLLSCDPYSMRCAGNAPSAFLCHYSVFHTVGVTSPTLPQSQVSQSAYAAELSDGSP